MACIVIVLFKILPIRGLYSTRHKLQFSCTWSHFVDRLIDVKF